MLSYINQKFQAVILNKKTNYFLGLATFSCLVFYVYFANVAVHTLTVLEKTKQELQALNIEVSDLESKRMSVQNGISKSLATRLGFIEINEKTFIINKDKEATLSLKTD